MSIAIIPRSRKGFEMAISTIVVMVLGIMIVGGGMALVYNLSSGSTDLSKQLTSEHRNNLRSLMSEGQLVAVYPASAKVLSGDEIVYAVGVRNVESDSVLFKIGLDDGTSDILGSGTTKVKSNFMDTINVSANSMKDAPIVLKVGKNVPAKEHTIIVDVKKIKSDGTAENYEKRFFTVNVK